MTNWANGYFAGVNYTSGYYKELNPAQMIAPLLAAGIQPPSIKHACELGFGMGISVNAHAAAGTAKWHTTDFNPSQAFYAKNLAEQAASDRLSIADQSFLEFCS